MDPVYLRKNELCQTPDEIELATPLLDDEKDTAFQSFVLQILTDNSTDQMSYKNIDIPESI